MNPILSETEAKMKSAITAMLQDFLRIRTGRANPNILDKVTVDYYGTETPVGQICNVTVPEARQLMLSPYEKNMLGPIEKAILKSDLGVTPSSDGSVIRINFPPMTEDRRKDLIKQVNQRTEEGAVAIRNCRHHANESLKALLKSKEISEDDVKGLEKKVQELTDKFVAECHAQQKRKDEELMEI